MDKKIKKYDPEAMDELRKQAARFHVSDGEKIPMELLENAVGGERLTNWKCPKCRRCLWYEYDPEYGGYFYCECGYFFDTADL